MRSNGRSDRARSKDQHRGQCGQQMELVPSAVKLRAFHIAVLYSGYDNGQAWTISPPVHAALRILLFKLKYFEQSLKIILDFCDQSPLISIEKPLFFIHTRTPALYTRTPISKHRAPRPSSRCRSRTTYHRRTTYRHSEITHRCRNHVLPFTSKPQSLVPHPPSTPTGGIEKPKNVSFRTKMGHPP